MFILLYLSIFTIISGKNWHKIMVTPRSVQPPVAHMQEGDSLTAYCGSQTPVNWSTSDFKILDSPHHKTGQVNITFKKLRLNDSTLYKCFGSYGNCPFIAFFSIYVYHEIIEQKVVPSWVEVPSGSFAALTCGSVKPVEWFYKHINEIQRIVGRNYVMLFHLERKHSGPYVCRGVTKYLTIFHASARVIVSGYPTLGWGDVLPDALGTLNFTQQATNL